jgi:hypothetical protein
VVQTTAVPAEAEAVVVSFMQAVSDSNLQKMGELWGNSKGSAAETGNPENWLQRVSIIQWYLKGSTSKILGPAPGVGNENRREILVQLDREGCVRQVPVTVVRTKSGSWLVGAIKLEVVGVPGRPCPTTQSG